MTKIVGSDRIAQPAPNGPSRNLVGSRPRPIKPAEKPTRTRCQRGHDLTTPNAFYTSKTGRTCRQCQLEKQRSYYQRKYRVGNAKLHPHKYRNWAEHIWETLTPTERMMVAHGLKAIRL